MSYQRFVLIFLSLCFFHVGTAAAQFSPHGVTLAGPFKLTAKEVEHIRDQSDLIDSDLNALTSESLCGGIKDIAPSPLAAGALGVGALFGVCQSMDEILADAIEEIHDSLGRLCKDLESLEKGMKCTYTPVDIPKTCDGIHDFCEQKLNPFVAVTVNADGDAYCWARTTIPGCTCTKQPRRGYFHAPIQSVIDEVLELLLPELPIPTVVELQSALTTTPGVRF